jgi:DNA-binding HxlR family transcriptional regulator
MPKAPPPCPAEDAIAILQEKWTLFIIRALLNGAKGFNELRRELECNPRTLTERLETLEHHGLICRTQRTTAHHSYELTKAGFALQNVILEIDRWSRKYLKAARGR